MIFIKGLKALLNGGRQGKSLFRISGENHGIKMIRQSYTDISIQSNSPIAVFVFCRMLFVRFIYLKRSSYSLRSVQPPPLKPVHLRLFSNPVEPRRQDGQVRSSFEMQTAVYPACYKAEFFSLESPKTHLKARSFSCTINAGKLNVTNRSVLDKDTDVI